jgi:16S rRNA (guanine1207-N2)-methyltransferase
VDCNPDGFSGSRWSRYAGNGCDASSWPATRELHSAGLLKLNKARDANLYALEALNSCLVPDAPIVLFGANDEGIKSVRQLGAVDFSVVDSLGHGRLLRGVRKPGACGRPEDFLKHCEVLLPVAGARRWASYPGCFAQGGVDPGTLLLLQSLDCVGAVPDRVLDFACGTGVIAADVLDRWPRADVEGCDYDAVAIAAARVNVPRGRFVVGDGLSCVSSGAFDLVVSNPPFHDGKVRSHRVWMNFVAEVRERLRPNGELRLVVQREVPVEGPLRDAFSKVERVIATPRFGVWSAIR